MVDLAGSYIRPTLSTILLLLCPTVAFAEPSGTVYEYRTPSWDGIGKVYMGREISHVMGHQGATWLERSGRRKEERTDILIARLPLEDAFHVADVGAGTGYFSFPVAERVPAGRVYAVDIQMEMLDIIKTRDAEPGSGKVVPVLGSETSVNLPANSIDLAFIVDAYHEFSHPFEMGQSLFTALKAGGRLVLIEYRAEDPDVMIKPLHKMTQKQARREMQALGFHWERTARFLPQQHFMIFQKPADSPLLNMQTN